MNTLLTAINTSMINLELSPSISPLSSGTIPTTLQNKTFSIDFQTVNSNKYRDKDKLRLKHSLKIIFIKQHGLDPAAVQADCITLEESIIRLLLNQTEFPSYRVSYESSNRILTFASEYVLTEITFDIEQDFSL